MNVRLLNSQLCGPSAKVTDPEVHCLFILCFCSGLSMCLTWEDWWLSNDRATLSTWPCVKSLLKVREQIKKYLVVCCDIGLWRGEGHLKAMQQYGRLPGSGLFFFFLIVQYFVRLRSIKDSRSKRVIYGFLISSSLLYIFSCAYLPLSEEVDDCSV